MLLWTDIKIAHEYPVGPTVWIQFIPDLFRIREYFEISEFKFSRFYCIS